MVRIKQRYILGELIFDEDSMTTAQLIEMKSILDAIRAGVQDAYGDMGLARLKQNFISKSL